MREVLDNFFSFFVPFFILQVHYWYISLPLLIITIIAYKKVKINILKKILRIILALFILTVFFTVLYFL